MDLTFKNPNVAGYFSNPPQAEPPVEEFKEAVEKPLVEGNFVRAVGDLMRKVEKKVEEGSIGRKAVKTLGEFGDELGRSYKGYLETRNDPDVDPVQVEGYAVSCLVNLRNLHQLGSHLLK